MTPDMRSAIKALVDERARERARREGVLIREIENRIRGVGMRSCEWCGASFYARHPATRFCCRPHANAAWKRTDRARMSSNDSKERQRRRKATR